MFVSSTYADLKAERQSAVEAILTLGHIPAGMELFAAGDETQMEVIKKWIAESDIFMLILGGRYGSIEPTSGKSYVHCEYEYAVGNNIPAFALVLSESMLDAKVDVAGKSVLEFEHQVEFGVFRELVKSRICAFCDDIKDIQLKGVQSIARIASTRDLDGWVRASEATDTKPVLEEMSMLLAENSRLRAEGANLAAENEGLRERTEHTSQSVAETKRMLLQEIIPRFDDKGQMDMPVMEALTKYRTIFIQGFHRYEDSEPEASLAGLAAPILSLYGILELWDGEWSLTSFGRQFLREWRQHTTLLDLRRMPTN